MRWKLVITYFLSQCRSKEFRLYTFTDPSTHFYQKLYDIINIIYESEIKSLTIERGENVLLQCIDDKLEEQIKQNAEFEGKVPH